MPGFDLKQIKRNDHLVIGGGIVAFLASFMPYLGWSYGPFSYSVNAWHSFAILGLLFIFAAAVITALRVFGNTSMPSLPVGPNVLVAGLAILGTLLVLIRGLTVTHYSLQWGGYLVLLAGIAEAVGAFMNFQASGEKVAWDATAINRGATGGGAPAATPNPPQGAAPTYPPAAPSYPPAAPSYPPAEPAQPPAAHDPGSPGV
jgi:hypothetical protein